MKRNLFLLSLIVLFVFAGCKQVKPVKTIENLKAGITGETTANAKYKAFADKAREEGQVSIARLFDAASQSEGIHAANHRKVLEELGGTMEDFTPKFEVKTTAENLQAAIEGETYEETTMYPQFLADAKAENANKATQSFTWAMDAEKKHEAFYKQALEALTANTIASIPVGYAVCPVCGNTYDAANMDEKCAFCQTDKSKFIII